MTQIHVEVLVTGSFVENGYVLYREGGREAVVIDPGAEPERWVDWMNERGLTPTVILGTHGHLDHLGAVAGLQAAFDSEYLVHADEVEMVEAVPIQCQMFGLPAIPEPHVTGHVVDGEIRSFAEVEFEVIATPGHTPGGTSFFVPEIGRVFTGDSLFAGSIGRTDLPGGDTERLLESLRRLCLKLPDDTIVCPGHGPETSISAERTGNPFFRVDR